MAFNQMPSADREAESLQKILPATAECLKYSKIMLAQPIILACLLLQLPTPSHSLAPLPSVRVGAQFPIFKTKANNYAEDAGGRRRQAAFLLGIQHINNKNDGFFDDVLPSTTLDIALYDSKRDEGVAVVNAFRMWDDFDAAIAVGPASSGPSKSAQQVLKVTDISIPQISYSATSDQLSDVSSYPLFLRTPPSDAYQATVIASTIKDQGWKFVCVLSGTDAYSAAGAAAILHQVDVQGLTLLKVASFEAGTASVADEVRSLKSAGCRLVSLWAQASDIVTVAKEANKQGLTGTNMEEPVLWFSSELLSGSFEDVCGSEGKGSKAFELCARVFKGALLVTSNFGPGSGKMYERLADVWHAQTTKVGTPLRSDLTGCDAASDARGASHHIWKRDHDGDTSTPSKCVAVDYADYDLEEAKLYAPETKGDGRISPYVTYAYDAALTVAHGLHRLFTSDAWLNAANTNEKQVELMSGTSLYAHLLGASFTGFSGEVRFRTKSEGSDNKYEGDREAADMEFFLWNFDGESDQFALAGRANGAGRSQNFQLVMDRPLVWPGDGVTKPDDRPTCLDEDFVRTMSECDGSTGLLTVISESNESLCRNVNTTKESSSPCLYAPFISTSGKVVCAVCGLSALTQFVALVWATYYRKTQTMKASQFELLALFNIGLLLTSLSPLLFLGPPSSAVCIGRLWHFNLSVALVWAPLSVKMWRVWMVFNNKSMKKLKLTSIKMLRYVCFILLFEVIVLLIVTFVPGVAPGVVEVPASVVFPRLGDRGHVHGTALSGLCSQLENGTFGAWATVQGLIHIGMVGAVSILAWKLRNEPSKFQESKYLGLVGMNVFSVGSIVGGVYFLMANDLPYHLLVVLQTFGVFVVVTIAVVLMYVPKAFNIRQGDQKWEAASIPKKEMPVQSTKYAHVKDEVESGTITEEASSTTVPHEDTP